MELRNFCLLNEKCVILIILISFFFRPAFFNVATFKMPKQSIIINVSVFVSEQVK